MVWVLKLGVILELNVVNGMAGSSMPVLAAINSCLFAAWSQGKNAELKRQDGLSDKPGI